jgi:hypothetical protein
MKHWSIGIVFVSLVFSFACNSKGTEKNKQGSSAERAETVMKAEKADQELTIETYCAVRVELRDLLMQNYWEKFKGKEYEEVKDLYDNYLEEEAAIYEKHGIEDPLDLNDFFREHFAAVEEYQRNNPDYIDYPEFSDARMALASFATAKALQ